MKDSRSNRSKQKRIGFVCSLCLLLLISSGCSSVNYTRQESGGEKVSFGSQSLFMKRAIKDLNVTSGERHLTLKGYSTSQTEIMEAALAAALAAYRQQLQSTPAPSPIPAIPAGTTLLLLPATIPPAPIAPAAQIIPFLTNVFVLTNVNLTPVAPKN